MHRLCPIPTFLSSRRLEIQRFERRRCYQRLRQGAIGKPNLPNTTLGWTIGGSWKGLSVSVLFQGSFNYSFSVNGTGIEPFKSQFQPLHQKRWTLERYLNGEAIEFPRLTSNPSTVNSAAAYMSDFWLIDAWYIRLKTMTSPIKCPQKCCLMAYKPPCLSQCLQHV